MTILVSWIHQRFGIGNIFVFFFFCSLNSVNMLKDMAPFERKVVFQERNTSSNNHWIRVLPHIEHDDRKTRETEIKSTKKSSIVFLQLDDNSVGKSHLLWTVSSKSLNPNLERLIYPFNFDKSKTVYEVTQIWLPANKSALKKGCIRPGIQQRNAVFLFLWKARNLTYTKVNNSVNHMR